MLHHHLFSLTVVVALALLSSAAPNQPSSVILRIEGWVNTIFEGTRIPATMWLKLRVEITIAMGRTTVQILFLVPLVPVRRTAHPNYLRIFSLSMGMFSYFTLRKMMANPLLGIVMVHFLPNLMISSSLPSVETLDIHWILGYTPQFWVHSSWGMLTRSRTRWSNLICFWCF